MRWPGLGSRRAALISSRKAISRWSSARRSAFSSRSCRLEVRRLGCSRGFGFGPRWAGGGAPPLSGAAFLSRPVLFAPDMLGLIALSLDGAHLDARDRAIRALGVIGTTRDVPLSTSIDPGRRRVKGGAGRLRHIAGQGALRSRSLGTRKRPAAKAERFRETARSARRLSRKVKRAWHYGSAAEAASNRFWHSRSPSRKRGCRLRNRV